MTQTSRVDLFDLGFKANPYPTYARLCSEAPIQRVTSEAISNPDRITREDLQNFARIVERGGLESKTSGR